MSGGGDTQTQTTERKPLAAAQPLINDILSQTQGLLNSGGLNPFVPNQPTIVGPSAQTSEALTALEAAARAGPSVGETGAAFAQNLIGSGGLNDQQNRVLASLEGLATGDDPRFREFAQLQAQDIANQVNSLFNAGGRTGSGANQQLLAQEVARATLGGELGRLGAQQTAAQTVLGANQAGQSQALQAAGLSPALDQASLFNANLLGSVGSAREAIDQRFLSDQLARQAAEQDAPFAGLQRAASLGVPIAGLGGTTTATVEQDSPSLFNSIAGTALGGLGLGAQLGLFGPTGSLFGSGLFASGAPGLTSSVGLRTGSGLF